MAKKNMGAPVEEKEQMEQGNERADNAVEATDSASPTWDDEAGRRHFIADGLHLTMALPNVDEQTQGDWEYSRVYVQALKQGILTKKEWEQLIAERGLVSDEHVKTDLVNRIREISLELNDEDHAPSEDRRQALMEELASIQTRYQQVTQEEDEFFNNTVERKAEQARLVFLAATCTRYDVGEPKAGERVWESLDAFRQERRNVLISTVLTQFMALAYGLSPEIADTLI